MIESLNSGWNALERGDLARARQIFEQHLDDGPHGGEVYRGLMRVEAARGNLQRAQTLGKQAVQIDDSAVNLTSLADVLGRQGKRREAEELLERAIRLDSSDPYARALLGEQRIRQGRWDEGTQDYIDALSSDPEGQAFRQFKIVIADMVDAMNQGRVPAEQAQKFINQVDYSVPKSDPEMQGFFGRVRRALHSGRSVQLESGRARDQHRYGDSSASRSESSRTNPSQPRQSPPPREQQVQSPRSQPPQRGGGRRRQKNRAKSQSAASEQSQRQQRGSRRGDNLDANQKDLVAVIKSDRSKNRRLLDDLPAMPPPKWPSKARNDSIDDIAAMPPPTWPSEAGYNSIDDVPEISMGAGAIFGTSVGIDTRDFSVTSGDLLTEIFLERCLRNLLVATQQNKATTIQLRPESFAQMEVNCRDGLLGEMRPPSPIYNDREGFDDFRRLAVGMFLGECLVRTFDGKWTFEVSPEESYLEVGTVLLEPFDLVHRWMSAEDKDSVFLEEITRQAARASRESTSMTISQDYIDPTKELKEKALASKLAEVWANYLFSITDASFSEIAETLDPLDVTSDVIVFALSPKWAPDYATGPDGAAVTDEEKVAVAYLRETGEFLPLSSRKSIARLLEVKLGALNGETARSVLEIVSKFHRPRWDFAANNESASRISKRVSGDVPTPKIDRNSGQTELRFWAASHRDMLEFVVSYDENWLMPWEVQTRRRG